jgi:hypothetical protein
MIHVLNNVTRDHVLQLVLLEELIGNKKNPLEVKKLREILNLRFERLSIQSKSSNESRENEEQDLIKVHSKGK